MSNPIKLLYIPFLLLFTINTYAQKEITPIQINDVKFRLPGEWKRIPESDWQEGGQYAFAETHTGVGIMIAVRNYEKDEYYKPGMKGFELVKAFYIWDSEYWASDKGIKAAVKKLKEDTAKNLIYWSVELKQGENIFLFGLKDGKIISINLNNTNKDTKMTETKAIEFLEAIFES